MVEADIERLREELAKLIEANAGYEQIYDLSVELDKLIVQYYNEKVRVVRVL